MLTDSELITIKVYLDELKRDKQEKADNPVLGKTRKCKLQAMEELNMLIEKIDKQVFGEGFYRNNNHD